MVNESMLMPGEQCKTKLTLIKKMPVIQGQTFTFRENGTTAATGVITKILKSIHVDKSKLNQVVLPGIKNKAQSSK